MKCVISSRSSLFGKRDTFMSDQYKWFQGGTSFVDLLCFCSVFCLLCPLYASVYMCFVVTCWERADLLALVCGVYCEFVTFPLASWVRCATWLYRFLIFASLLTFINYQCSKRIFARQLSPKIGPFIYFHNVCMRELKSHLCGGSILRGSPLR